MIASRLASFCAVSMSVCATPRHTTLPVFVDLTSRTSDPRVMISSDCVEARNGGTPQAVTAGRNCPMTCASMPMVTSA